MAFDIGGALGLSQSKSKTTGYSTSTTSGITEILGMDEASKARLDELLSTLMGRTAAGPDKQFSKEAAIADSQAAIGDIFSTFSKTALPAIFQQQGKAGAYNSTGSQLMANDAFATANSKAAGLVLDNIARYATLSQQQQSTELDALLKTFGLQTDAYKKETTNETTSGTSTSSTKGTSATASLKGSMGF